MELSIFKIPRNSLEALRARLQDDGYTLIHAYADGGWDSEFWFEEGEDAVTGWVKRYESFFQNREVPTRKEHAGLHIFHHDSSCYAASYGSGHHQARSLCDYEFGLDLAKRIANERDVKQTGTKRSHSVRRRESRVYRSHTHLDIEGGESIDQIRAAIIGSKRDMYGTAGNFSASAALSPPIDIRGIPAFLSSIETELKNPEQFSLPRETPVKDKQLLAVLDDLLLDAILGIGDQGEFATNSLDLCDADFNSLFGKPGKYDLKARHKKSMLFPEKGFDHDLTVADLRLYISSRQLTRDEILAIEITRFTDDGDWHKPHLTLKQALEYTVDSHRATLSGGVWKQFNQDYLAFIDKYVREIKVEPTEEIFEVLTGTEPSFNDSDQVGGAGYKKADKDFSLAVIASGTPVEAWDLSLEKTVFAVKFGTAQKLGYVCDQATTVLELIRNKATVTDLAKPERYCLWLGYKAKKLPANIADIKSVILKQKIADWAKLCLDVGVVPVIKLSRHAGSDPTLSF
ncbi:TIGR04141 family sporadically distributed protein [Nocardia sp. NBC_01377]|uniref:DUF6119 family protein n=1 Tax=Nocardia sp. NBC_01377 TaxID=2903595 RepID=UPI0032521F70